GTRALTRARRARGAQEGIISTVETDTRRLADRARALPGLTGRDLVSEVTVAAPHGWSEGDWDIKQGYRPTSPARYRVVAFDSGIKSNILRRLASLGCALDVVPAGTPVGAGLGRKPHGLFLSNCPGPPPAGAALLRT